VVIHHNNRQQLLDVWEGAFEGEVSLRRGRNHIRVVAMGPRGPLAERSVEVEYVPPSPTSAIRIVRPADGTVFSAENQDVIEVEGEVSEQDIRQVWLTFNEFSIPVAVGSGRFKAVVPVVAPEMTISVEAHGPGGSHASDPVRIRREPYKPTKAYALLYLPSVLRRVEARLWLAQRGNPADADSARQVTSHVPASIPGSEQPSMLFVLPATRPGAYAVALDYRITLGDVVEKGWGVVIVPGADAYRSLRLGPFRLTGKGRAVLAKFILPHGIFWEEDYWFTAFAEGSGSFSKFRHADGVSWTEPKSEPEFPTAR
jgi:hypothetical protein